jgi:hypothetical protein
LLLVAHSGLSSAVHSKEPIAPPLVTSNLEPEAMAVLATHGSSGTFTPLYLEAVSTFFKASDAYNRHAYGAAEQLIDDLFGRHAAGSAEWMASMKGAAQSGLNFGTPPCYYALRMLKDCSAWKREHGGSLDSTSSMPVKLRWTVVLVKHLQSKQPRSMAEWRNGSGPVRRFELNAGLTEPVVLEASDLFRRYIEAISGGQLKVDLRFHYIDEPIKGVFNNFPNKHIGLGRIDQVLDAVPERVKRETDWWWIIYPSTVPDNYPDFKKQEFVSGGTHYPAQGGLCFVADDLWLLRKPPHLGFGIMEPCERRAYLPQWLQHEFFHYLFKTYPEYKLEGAKGHEWFDRSTWPQDFAGQFEPDYYYEALHKRILKSHRPLWESLGRHMPALDRTDLSGSYVRKPEENGWHRGLLKAEAVDGRPAYRWINKAGVGWNLYSEPGTCILLTDKNCPYFNDSAGKEFHFAAHCDESGRVHVFGFYFNGEFYERDPSVSGFDHAHI